jgi:hypothetical protein
MQDYHVEKDIEESQQGSGEQAAGGKKASRAPNIFLSNKRKKDGTTPL